MYVYKQRHFHHPEIPTFQNILKTQVLSLGTVEKEHLDSYSVPAVTKVFHSLLLLSALSSTPHPPHSFIHPSLTQHSSFPLSYSLPPRLNPSSLSFVHSIARPLFPSITPLLPHFLPQSPPLSFVHSITCPLSPSIITSLLCPLHHSSTFSLNHYLSPSSTLSLIHFLPPSLPQSPTLSFIHSITHPLSLSITTSLLRPLYHSSTFSLHHSLNNPLFPSSTSSLIHFLYHHLSPSSTLSLICCLSPSLPQ